MSFYVRQISMTVFTLVGPIFIILPRATQPYWLALQTAIAEQSARTAQKTQN